MSDMTKIEWCDHTFSPWEGCKRVSTGCANCYAAALSKRWGHRVWDGDDARTMRSLDYWKKPFLWDKHARSAGKKSLVFCGSMCDVFDEFDSDQVRKERKRLWMVIENTRYLMWLLLTKRPQNIMSMIPRRQGKYPFHWPPRCWEYDPPANVCYMTSIEDQATEELRVDELCRVPAYYRGLSVEPLLEKVDLHLNKVVPMDIGWKAPRPRRRELISWIIVGGESGAKARPCALTWLDDVVAQATAASIPVFVKQWGTCPHFYENMPYPHLRDYKGGDPKEWPVCLNVRQTPAAFFMV